MAYLKSCLVLIGFIGRTPISELCKIAMESFMQIKGNIGKKLSEKWSESDVDLVTTVRKNMKAKAMYLFDREMLSKRYIIETIN